jgi:hypothetical protein
MDAATIEVLEANPTKWRVDRTEGETCAECCERKSFPPLYGMLLFIALAVLAFLSFTVQPGHLLAGDREINKMARAVFKMP